MPDLYVMHRAIRRIAGWAVWSFFAEVHVIGEENVPKDGPLIVVATHHNMILDPSVLSAAVPHRRILHYWAKATLFAHPVGKYVLTSSGVIPVDRKSKDNQVLFRGTFECLARSEAMAIFPEGTSYTEPRIMQVKDGASWSALEYLKWARLNPDKASKNDVQIVPVGIVYTNKSKYRSDVILDFGKPIRVADYEQEFLSGDDGAPRAAVKQLTQRMEADLIRTTVNAPDWDTLFAARMARDLLWEKEKSINLEDFVAISQTLVDLFSTTDVTPNFTSVRRHLLKYYSLLQYSHLTNSSLSSLPLPRTLDPHHPARLPSRLFTLFVLVKDSFACFIRLPFFIFPLMIHFPAYLISRYGAHLAQDEEETMAQNKVVFALLVLLLLYPTVFYFLWAFLWYTPIGAVAAASIVWLLSVYHVKIIDDNYEHAKRLIAAWRVLVGVWIPKRYDLSMAALAQYTTPQTPAESPWIDRNKQSLSPPPPSKPTSSSSGGSKKKRQRRPPTRRLVRHVLRARAEAAQALASFFAELERGGTNKRIFASPHLATKYGTVGGTQTQGLAMVADGVEVTSSAGGWRAAREVVSFLRERGAKIAALQDRREADWVAVSSEAEDNSDTPAVEKDEIVWVPPSVQSR